MAIAPSTSAVSSVALTVPRTGIDLTVVGGFVAEQSETPTENRWTVYGLAGRAMNFSWKRRIDDRRASLPLRTRAKITELVALGEETSLITASVRIDVVEGVAREVAIATPEGVTVNNVTGATVGRLVAGAGHADRDLPRAADRRHLGPRRRRNANAARRFDRRSDSAHAVGRA